MITDSSVNKPIIISQGTITICPLYGGRGLLHGGEKYNEVEPGNSAWIASPASKVILKVSEVENGCVSVTVKLNVIGLIIANSYTKCANGTVGVVKGISVELAFGDKPAITKQAPEEYPRLSKFGVAELELTYNGVDSGSLNSGVRVFVRAVKNGVPTGYICSTLNFGNENPILTPDNLQANEHEG